ncbi:MAG TPA: hypothetical protein VH796_11365 [Nitrososphaeraceae archaeon]
MDRTNKIGLAIAIIAVVAVMTSLSATQAVAKKHHDDDKPTGSSAMERGAHDATCNSDDCSLYITQPGKGFGDHSSEFNHNYIKGYCAAGGGGSDADQATFDCNRDNN